MKWFKSANYPSSKRKPQYNIQTITYIEIVKPFVSLDRVLFASFYFGCFFKKLSQFIRENLRMMVDAIKMYILYTNQHGSLTLLIRCRVPGVINWVYICILCIVQPSDQQIRVSVRIVFIGLRTHIYSWNITICDK